MINVQFRDAAESVIVASFSGPQDPEIYKFQGQVSEDDERYVLFLSLIAI